MQQQELGMQEGMEQEAGLLLDDHVEVVKSPNRRLQIGAAALASILAATALVLSRRPTSQAGIATQQKALMQADEEAVECAWEGENCVNSKCCKRAGFTCWEREQDSWASCSQSCEDLTKFGGDWTCAGLGAPGAPRIVEQSGVAPASVTLFCFAVKTDAGMVPPGVEEGYEGPLLEAIEAAGLSLFACEASKVYDGARADTGEWKSIMNTDIFIDVWKRVQADGLYQQNDWTVKVDIDAVFLPDRLKMHITGSQPPANEAVYFHNIDFKFNFMGALECMSKEAADRFIQNLDDCKEHIGVEGGEDIFTKECLDSIGVGYMEDYSILDDKYSDPANFDLFDVDRCDNDAIVAFHPYKAVNSWMGCHKVAMGEVNTDQFTSCVHRWDGEGCSLSSTMDHPGLTDPGTGIVG